MHLLARSLLLSPLLLAQTASLHSAMVHSAARAERRASPAHGRALVDTGLSRSFLPAASAERCAEAPTSATSRTPQQWLDLAASRVFPSAFNNRVLQLSVAHDVPFWEQSDRTYEPFIPNIEITTQWLDPATGVVGRHADAHRSHTQYPSLLYGSRSSFAGRDTVVMPAPAFQPFAATLRLINPWVVLLDWRAHAADVRVVQRCVYRDYPRIVLARGAERLYLTEVDGVPVKLERIEPHYLWGQVKAEYLWTTWWAVGGGGLYPLASFRLFDGTTYERAAVNIGSPQLVSSDSAPRLTLPAAAPMRDRVEIASPSTDTVRVNASTFLLVTPAYTEAVTLQRDTVFLLDATSGETRGRQDSTWIAKLFPGKHPVVLVVTDLAWPHISSVRYWVARGAIIVSHQISGDFIRRVVNRRWTLEPDALEKVRATARLRLRLVDDSASLAGGAVRVHAMLGNTTEGAIAVWLPGERFLWAGDFIQRTSASPYYLDVVRTARTLGLHPEKVGAQHIALLNWADVDKRVPPD